MSGHPYVMALMGGVLIGLSAWLLLAGLGRVAGISGIAAKAVFGDHDAQLSADERRDERRWSAWFIAGLLLAGAVFTPLLAVTGSSQPLWKLAVGGLLVGIGTTVGSGCTSGHGVCGLGRRSMRALVATLVFMGTAIATVFITMIL